MKVTLIIYHLGCGGAERVMSILANYWVSHGWNVTLIVLVDATEPSFYPLDPRVKLHPLEIAGNSTHLFASIASTWRRIKILRQAIIASQADVSISFMNAVNVYNILACWNLAIPTIVCEHTYPGSNDASQIWQTLMKWFYRYADLVTVLTQSAVPFYDPAAGYQTIVMPNPVLPPPPVVVTEKLLPTPSLVSVGRLDACKGFDLLLKAFRQIHDRHPDWQLTILGEGELRSELEELRSQLGLTDCVHFPGNVSNVQDYLYQADLFVMPSRIEGFPMALCEAMVCGLPVVATDCLSGPSDIIEHDVNGLLVRAEEINAIAIGLELLISDPVRREQLANHAPNILDRFGLETVMKLWADAIDRASRHCQGIRHQARSNRIF